MKRLQSSARVGLILSGGGARGFAHIGVLRVLERYGIEPRLVAGTSMGAIIGALYASGRSAEEIRELALGTSLRDILDISLQAGLLKGDRLAAYLAEHLPARFDELEMPLAITTTDIETGDQVILTDGDLITALRASASFPCAFEPIEYRGRVLADGGIVNNLPVEAASYLGAGWTVASDVTPERRASYTPPSEEGNWWERMLATVKLERRNPMLQMMLRSTDIMQSILTDIQYTLHPADLLIKMPLTGIRLEAFWEAEEIMERGVEAAEAACRAAGLTPLDTPQALD